MYPTTSIDTQRLTLQTVEVSDTNFFFQLLNSSNWLRYIGDKGIRAPEDALDYMEDRIFRPYEEYGYGLYKMVVKETRVPIGICGFIKRDYLDHPDIGFAILPAYERQGYTYEAATAVLEYGRTVLNLAPILAITTPDNHNSRSLLLKLGLVEQAEIQPGPYGKKYRLFSTDLGPAQVAPTASLKE